MIVMNTQKKVTNVCNVLFWNAVKRTVDRCLRYVLHCLGEVEVVVVVVVVAATGEVRGTHLFVWRRL